MLIFLAAVLSLIAVVQWWSEPRQIDLDGVVQDLEVSFESFRSDLDELRTMASEDEAAGLIDKSWSRGQGFPLLPSERSEKYERLLAGLDAQRMVVNSDRGLFRLVMVQVGAVGGSASVSYQHDQHEAAVDPDDVGLGDSWYVTVRFSL